MLIWEGDEIKCRSPNFVTLRKNNILRLQHCRREKWIWTIARHILCRFQYRKIIWGHLKKVWRKKIFSLKSMTKLEDLTVQPINHVTILQPVNKVANPGGLKPANCTSSLAANQGPHKQEMSSSSDSRTSWRSIIVVDPKSVKGNINPSKVQPTYHVTNLLPVNHVAKPGSLRPAIAPPTLLILGPPFLTPTFQSLSLF